MATHQRRNVRGGGVGKLYGSPCKVPCKGTLPCVDHFCGKTEGGEEDKVRRRKAWVKKPGRISGPGPNVGNDSQKG